MNEATPSPCFGAFVTHPSIVLTFAPAHTDHHTGRLRRWRWRLGPGPVQLLRAPASSLPWASTRHRIGSTQERHEYEYCVLLNKVEPPRLLLSASPTNHRETGSWRARECKTQVCVFQIPYATLVRPRTWFWPAQRPRPSLSLFHCGSAPLYIDTIPIFCF